MPIIVTFTAITYLFVSGSRRASASFFDPAALRRKLEELPEESTRTQALALADRLDTLAREYDMAAEAAMTAVGANIEKWTSSASSLIESLQEQDQVRARVLRGLVELRQSFLETLSANQWQQVFAT